MQQTARIIDPEYTRYNKERFSRDGKQLISLMRETGVKKEVRDAVRVYLAAQNTVLKKSPKAHDELTRYGSPLTSSAFQSDTMGIYNPDTIPISTYAKMKNDSQVAIGLAVIKMPIYSLNWSIECGDIDIKEFVHETLKPIWNKLIKSMMTAIDFGFASHEKVWELRDLNVVTEAPRKKTHFKGKAEVYKKIKPHYPGTIKIRTDSKTDDFLGILQSIGGTGQEIKLDADKCFLFSLGDDFGNFFGSSRLKPAYKPWYWKEVLSQFMLRYFERRGSPATVVEHPMGGGIDLSGNEYDNSEIALRIGQNIIENSVVTLPVEPDKNGKNQWNVKYLEDERRGEMFVSALNYLGAQILRALLTPERVMTQDLSTGSFSMATSHAEIFLLSQEGLISEIESAINTQIIPELVYFNFKPKKVVPCRVKIEKIQYDRKRLLKEIYVAMINNLNTIIKSGETPSFVPSLVDMAEVLGIPVRPFEEEYTVDNSNSISNGQPGNPKSEKTKPEKQSPKASYEIKSKKFKDMTKKDWLDAYKKGEIHWAKSKEHSPLAETLIQNDELNNTKGDILEIGCGNGRDSRYFGSLGYKVKSIDISPEAIDLAKKNNPNKNVEYLVGDAEKLEFDDNQFDLIYSLSVLHSTDMRKSFKEMHRVLKENGLALVFLYIKTEYTDFVGNTKTELNFKRSYLDNILSRNKFEIVDEYETESEEEKDENGTHKHSILVLLLQNGGD